MFVILAELLSM